MIEIHYKDDRIGSLIINLKNISMISCGQEDIVFWSTTNEYICDIKQEEIKENLQEIYQRAKVLLMRM